MAFEVVGIADVIFAALVSIVEETPLTNIFQIDRMPARRNIKASRRSQGKVILAND